MKIEEIMLIEKSGHSDNNIPADESDDTPEILFQDVNEPTEDDTNLLENPEVQENEEIVENEHDENQYEERRTRNIPRIDYSILNSTGERVLVASLKTKNDYSTVCIFCKERGGWTQTLCEISCLF